MPSPYSPPDVIVTQQRLTVSATVSAPPLPVCIVAPCVAIVTKQKAGDYSAGSAFQAALPGLPPGASVLVPSLQILLEARSDGGAELGLFQLDIPGDAQLAPDNVSILVDSSIALAYSLLSARNNQGPGTGANDDFGSGVPDGINFTDDSVDFLSMGASINDTDIVINSPASIAGTYRIYEMVGGGTGVNEVRVEQLSDVSTGAKVLQKTFSITGYTNVNGTAIINGSDTDATGADVGLIAPGGTVYSIGTSDYPSSGGFNLPAASSASQVIVAMPGGQPSNVVAAWAGLVNSVKVGDFLRVAGDSLSAANGDYKIVGINTSTPSITVQRLGQSGSGQITTTGGGSATMKALRVLRGQADQTNGAGDYVTMTIAGVETNFEVLTASPKRITLTEVVTGLTGATAVTCRRGIGFRSTVASYDLVKRLTSGFGGSVLVSYEASRTDVSLNGLIEIGSEQDIIDNFGVIHPDNPIALMCEMVTRSGLTDGNRSFFALAVDDNTLASHEAALDTLTSEDVYYLVPATQENAILDIYEAHVDAQSQPENKHERIFFGTTAITTVEQIIPVDAGDPWPTDGLVDSGTPKIFGSVSIDWTKVSPGDVVKILASSDANAAVIESHRIQTVDVSGKQATCLDEFSASVLDEAQIFRIDTFPFTKDQQAADWRDFSKSIADFRVFIIRPDVVQITYTDTTGPSHVDKQIVVPTYYLAAAFAGLCSSLPPQAPMTNVKLPGVDTLFHSNGYFNPEQLNTIAEGGNCIFVQDTKTAAPYAREQLSTDMTSLITRTLSITKNVDFAAKYIRNSLRPYVGNKNITPEYLTQLRGICESVIRGLRRMESMLSSTQLVSLSQNVDQPDAIDIVIALDPPYPANKIYVTLQI